MAASESEDNMVSSDNCEKYPSSRESTQDLGTPNKERSTKSKAGLFDFGRAEEVKEKVRASKLKKDVYDVKMYYHERGFFTRIASNIFFENFTLAVITLNAIWIGIDTDRNHGEHLADPDTHAVFKAADCLFLAYFTAELFIRFMAFANKLNCMKDAWFVFDSFLVLMYWFDPVVISIMAQSGGASLNLPTSILRLFRLARLSRLVRLLRSFPELLILVKGIWTALASVSYTLGLLVLAAYVFAIALTQLGAGYEWRELYFSSVPHGMYSLFIYGTFLDDLAAFGDPILAEDPIAATLCVVFVVLANMTLMNMLIGVLCEVIDSVAATEKEGIIVEKVKEKFAGILQRLDSNNNGMLSWPEFKTLLTNPAVTKEVCQALESVGVDVVSVVDVAEEYFFYMGEPVEMSFREFMEMILELRGGQQAMVKDVILLGKRFNKKFYDIKSKLKKLCDNLDTLAQRPRP
jgi:hypothetical protein